MDLYRLGVEIEDRVFRNAIVTATFEAAQDLDRTRPGQKLPYAYSVYKAYESDYDGEDSTLKRALVEIFARATDAGEVGRYLDDDETPRKFFVSLVRRLIEPRSEESKTLKDINICDFHELEEGQQECDHRKPASERQSFK